jgi:hypothetical protein
MAAVAHGSTKYDNLPRDCPLRRMHLFNLNRLPGNSIDAMLDMSRPAPGMIASLLYGLACTAITGLFMSFPIVLYALIAKPAGAVEASMTERLGSRLVIFGALAPITPITYFYDPELGTWAWILFVNAWVAVGFIAMRSFFEEITQAKTDLQPMYRGMQLFVYPVAAWPMATGYLRLIGHSEWWLPFPGKFLKLLKIPKFELAFTYCFLTGSILYIAYASVDDLLFSSLSSGVSGTVRPLVGYTVQRVAGATVSFGIKWSSSPYAKFCTLALRRAR